MKKAIHAFLTAGFFLSFVYIALGILLIPLAFVVDDKYAKIAMIVWGSIFLVFGTLNMIGMIIIRKKWENITSKAQAKPLAIWAIVLGALFTYLPIAAGVMMLAMPAHRYEK